jgi:hypothetical protein
VAPNSSSTNTEGSAQHSSVSKRDRKFSNLLSCAAGVQVLFYRPATIWFAPFALVPLDSRAESP